MGSDKMVEGLEIGKGTRWSREETGWEYKGVG